MSRHGDTRYWSSSKGELLEIDTLPTKYLANAAKKMVRDLPDMLATDDPQAEHGAHPDGAPGVLVSMIDELASRIPAAEV